MPTDFAEASPPLDVGRLPQSLLQRTGQPQLPQGIDLDYRDIEWFAFETNRDHSQDYCRLSEILNLTVLKHHSKHLITAHRY